MGNITYGTLRRFESGRAGRKEELGEMKGGAGSKLGCSGREAERDRFPLSGGRSRGPCSGEALQVRLAVRRNNIRGRFGQ